MRVPEPGPQSNGLVFGQSSGDAPDEIGLRTSVVGVAGRVALDTGASERSQHRVEIRFLAAQAVNAVEDHGVAFAGESPRHEVVESLALLAVPGAAREIEVLKPLGHLPALLLAIASDLVPLNLGRDHVVALFGDADVGEGAHQVIKSTGGRG